ncbi:lanthionine synthetase C family protein [Kribbella koreensis]|uniref:lanthionine synthetase C family protein n=1 Tax=Kribbella koreensis TaxID=57909 RepID=UPI0031D625A1
MSGVLAERAGRRALEVAGLVRQVVAGDPEYAGGLEGTAGAAVLFGQLDRIHPDQGWDVAAHECVKLSVREIEETANTEPGLFNGLGGLAFTAWSLSRGGTRYAGLLAGLDDRVTRGAVRLAEEFTAKPYDRPIVEYDVISGLSGITGYLLLRKDEPAVAEALPKILEALVAFCGIGPGGPNWFVSPETLGPAMLSDIFPAGMYNLGLAHGIPGPLALLALAYDAGQRVDGQLEAIERVAHWLVDQRCDDEWGPGWSIGAEREPTPRHAAHNAWCYGSAGVARALWLAGRATGDDRLRAEALETMDGIYRRPSNVRGIDNSPGLCHGVGGLLQLTSLFAAETATAGDVAVPAEVTAAGAFEAEAAGQVERLLELFDPELRTGYYALETEGARNESVGLLDGAAGAALALLAATTAVDPVWDRLLLMA